MQPELDCSPRARPLVGLGSWGGDRTHSKLRVRDLEAEAPGMGRVSSPMWGAGRLLGATVRGGGGRAGRRRVSAHSELVRCMGGFVQTCLPFVPACRTPRMHDVISDALSWNSSKLNN